MELGSSLKNYGEYQQIELDLLLQIINSNTVVYDVGSNIGYHASAFASKSQQVYCFEANLDHFKMLKLNLNNNPRCHLFNNAIGNTVGEILVEEFDPYANENYGAVRVGSNQGRAVKLVTLDSLDLPLPDFIKIDVEGYELPVLQGALNLIKQKLPVIYFEAQESKDLDKIYYLLKDFGYILKWVCVKNFNTNNFFNNQNNLYENSAIFSILCYQPNTIQTELEDVLGPNDSWEKVIDRANKK